MEASQQVPDLGKLRDVEPEVAARALLAAEMQAGLRCNACGQRIEQGLHCFLLSPVHADGGVMVQTRRLAVCDREGCAWFGLDASGEATYTTPVNFTWVAEDPAAIR